MVSSVSSLDQFRKEPLVTIQPHTLVMHAQELARRNGIHHLPVLDRAHLLGVICTCDMLICPGDQAVERIMKTPVTLEISSDVEEAALLMERRGVGSVLLVEELTVVGIVTRGDVFEKASAVAEHALLSVCECCGVRSHLRSQADGKVYCVYCQAKELSANLGGNVS